MPRVPGGDGRFSRVERRRVYVSARLAARADGGGRCDRRRSACSSRRPPADTATRCIWTAIATACSRATSRAAWIADRCGRAAADQFRRRRVRRDSGAAAGRSWRDSRRKRSDPARRRRTSPASPRSARHRPGTVYIRGRRDAQYAVRIFGETGKTRMLKFDATPLAVGDALTSRPDRRRRAAIETFEEHRIVSTRVRPGHRARLIDVSAGGALIETSHRLLPGTSVELQVETGTHRTNVRGRVLRCAMFEVRPSWVCYRGAIGFDRHLPWLLDGDHGAAACGAARSALPDRADVTREVI